MKKYIFSPAFELGALTGMSAGCLLGIVIMLAEVSHGMTGDINVLNIMTFTALIGTSLGWGRIGYLLANNNRDLGFISVMAANCGPYSVLGLLLSAMVVNLEIRQIEPIVGMATFAGVNVFCLTLGGICGYGLYHKTTA
jgi:hypothetical protein